MGIQNSAGDPPPARVIPAGAAQTYPLWSEQLAQAVTWVARMAGHGAAACVLVDPANHQGEPELRVTAGCPPLCESLCRSGASGRCQCVLALQSAAREVVGHGTANTADSPLGPETIYAVPFVAGTADGRTAAGGLAAFCFSASDLHSVSRLAEALGLAEGEASEAVEAAAGTCLTPSQVAACRAAMDSLASELSQRLGAGGAWAVVDQGDRPADFREMGSPREMLVGLMQHVAREHSIPHVRAWLNQPADRCAECAYEAVCAGASRCLHAVAAVGAELEDEFARVPLAQMPASFVAGLPRAEFRPEPEPGDGPIGQWLTGASGSPGALGYVPFGYGAQAVLAFAHPEGLPPRATRLMEHVCQSMALALSTAHRVQSERRELQRVAATAARLAAQNLYLQRAADAYQGLLQSISHELRTPLNAIIGFSELIADGGVGEVNPQQAAYLTTVAGSGRQLEQLISDLLDLAAIETGGLVMRPEPCEVAEVLAEACEAAQPMADSRRVIVEAGLPPQEAVFVTDPTRLRQIATHLLCAAIGVTAVGCAVFLGAELDAEGLHLRVGSRAGSGGAASPWTEAGAKLRQEASGLGLSLVNRLVEAQGGSLALGSREAAGDLARVTLPQSPDPPTERTPGPAAGWSEGPIDSPMEAT